MERGSLSVGPLAENAPPDQGEKIEIETKSDVRALTLSEKENRNYSCIVFVFAIAIHVRWPKARPPLSKFDSVMFNFGRATKFILGPPQ